MKIGTVGTLEFLGSNDSNGATVTNVISETEIEIGFVHHSLDENHNYIFADADIADPYCNHKVNKTNNKWIGEWGEFKVGKMIFSEPCM